MDAAEQMRRYWDERARENAAWYVDTSLSYAEPDMERFFETGRAIVRQALHEAPVQPSRRELAVEIGPGLGRICLALADEFDQVVGVDVSEEMVTRARATIGDRPVSVHVGDGVSLRPVDDASADFVTSFTVLQHLPSKALVLAYLAEAGRVLRPGGVAALQWNNLPHPWRWRVQSRARHLRARLGVGGADQREAPEFLGTRVSTREITDALAKAGLTVVGTRGEGTLFAWVWAQKI